MKDNTDTKKEQDPIINFIESVKQDSRINSTHISLYVSLVHQWMAKGKTNPLSVYRQDIMSLCKISGTATYHKSIRELHEYGYIKYVPSFNHFLGSLVYI
ncbi:hypothetical protein [Ferruginibacter sp.]|uniref:hypothetical protein n=1 Tax=Ferruginibacter sp. TaxID=1940288 RepID=UPI0026594E84|nr:hypothetical protein [Ferruginibacter sp.]